MARLNSCNILQTGPSARHVWQFDASKFTVNREQHLPNGQALPASMVGKSWSSLWQPKLNVAWLPAERVFLRVVHVPRAEGAETRQMVELQLEKLSPLPTNQVVWGIHVLPHPAAAHVPAATPAAADETKVEDLQTVIVIVVARDLVEEFLGQLEKDGFLADRLETPLLDQLLAAAPAADGAWIYAGNGIPGENVLVAWWQGGILQNLGLVQLPADKADAEPLREQFAQMAWAGELEGWLTSAPQWHMVASDKAVQEWRATFEQALSASVKTVAAPSIAELAASTARRSARPENTANLMPVEYATRYHQQFVDRLWLRGLLSVGLLYVAGVIIYFIALQVLQFQTNKAVDEVNAIGGAYTNAIQMKAQYQIMKDREDLKFAALNCWKKTAELLPQGATLESLDFHDGTRLSLRGTAPAGSAVEMSDFNAAMKKARNEETNELLFRSVDGLTYNVAANNMISWSFSCDLNHTEGRE